MDYFLGEIRLFASKRIPRGWLECKGQALPISRNQALYALIGKKFGGDMNNFNLPNLQYRAIRSTTNPSSQIGNQGGSSAVALTSNQIPSHTHELGASHQIADTPVPQEQSLPANTIDEFIPFYGTKLPNTTGSSRNFTSAGASAPHNNMQPSLAMVYCISTDGMWPPRR
ncbi:MULTISPECIES: phage tail protein [Idiomarinaceae]|uniref:Tail fiber protein n=1 Tax=Pseudidiomarina fusca TaxID=2965078 RepID=A0ABU3KZD1_9GAMM|nr:MULTISPECIES: tail fiber protein [Idiomarinaceae]MDT7526362.1 tail fiber protein [Pseudidiomarina sp. GXY010]MRJ43217.1 phage tail protein [Idiomarina sp. FeN1]NCU58733.1 phage tail protein [Idiomarina sp. FenA--70]NCU61429.1 phage tail protein [Idiomarina sp. FenBw--71]UUN12694.1 tail fiber protein [Idiomarina loihiensis]